MKIFRIIILITAAALLVAVPIFWHDAFGADAGQPLPVLAGVYKSRGALVILANHPDLRSEYIGQIVYDSDQKVQPMRIKCDSIQGCHGVIYSGTLEKQKAVELTLQGEKLSVRYYDGPTLLLEREKQN